MAGKAGGRLTFSGRQEYEVVPLYFTAGPLAKSTIAYAAICHCSLGDHYLAPDGEQMESYLFATYADAQAAIEQWQRQHDAAQAASGESEG